MAGACEFSNEPLVSIKCRECLAAEDLLALQ